MLDSIAMAASSSTTGFQITESLVAPIKNAIDSGLSTLVPIGIGVMSVMIGISLIPRIIYKFL